MKFETGANNVLNHELEKTPELKSVDQAIAALAPLAELGEKRRALERRGQERLLAIARSSRLTEAEASPYMEEAEAQLRSVYAQARANQVKAEWTLLHKIRDWSSKHKKAAAFLLASVMAHAPATPQARAVYDMVTESIQGITDWEKPNMVLRPQTDEERQAVTDRIYERGARSDAKGAEEYKRRTQNELEAGQDVLLKKMKFDLERLAGEKPEDVERAKRVIDDLIEKYAAQMGDNLSEAFIRREVSERMGPDSDYEWGQGSLTKRMLTGKRNCSSFASEQQIIFEGLIKRLPPEKQARYEIGMSFEKKHEIATLTLKRADGSVEATYLLQLPVDKIQNARDRAGSPTIPLSMVKKAMVSKEPVRVTADAKGQPIQDSPDLDTVSDQPVGLNIKIDGKLRGSDYVRQVAERQGVKPVETPPLPPAQVGEWEISPEYLGSQHEGVEAARAIKAEAFKNKRFHFDAASLVSPTPQAVAELNVGAEDGIDPKNINSVVFGDVSKWEKEAVREALRLRFRSISVKSFENGALPTNFLEALEEESGRYDKYDNEGRISRTLVLRLPGSERPQGRSEVKMPAAELEKFLHAARLFETVNLWFYSVDEPEAIILAKAPQKNFAINGRNLSAKTIEILGRSKKGIFIESYFYMENVKNHPEIVKYQNITTNIFLALENDPDSAFVYLRALQRYFPPNHQNILEHERLLRHVGLLPMENPVNGG